MKLAELIGHHQLQPYIREATKILIDQFGASSGNVFDTYVEFWSAYGDKMPISSPYEVESLIDADQFWHEKFRDWLPKYFSSTLYTAAVKIRNDSDSKGNTLKLYRSISEDADWYPNRWMGQSLGVYWTHDYHAAEAHWAQDRHSDRWLIEGWVDISSIDWVTTLVNYVFYSGENEIHLKSDETVLVTQLYLADANGHWTVPSEVADYPKFYPERLST